MSDLLDNQILTEQTKADLIDMGAIQKTIYDGYRSEMEKYILLYKVKKRKSYKEQGMTWEDFCNVIGESTRTVDRNLKELQPVINNFLDASQKMLGMELPRVKLLARSLNEHSDITTGEGSLIVNGETIPFDEDHKADIEQLIDDLIYEKKEAKKKQNQAAKEHKLALERKDTVIQKLRDNIKKYEVEIKETQCTPEELSCLKDLDTCKKTIEGITGRLMPGNFLSNETTPKMKAAYMSILAYMKRLSDDLWEQISPNRPPELLEIIDSDGEQPLMEIIDDDEDTTNI